MIIGIDASRAFLKNRTGIEEYSYQIIKNLVNNLKNHQVILYIKPGQWPTVISQQFPKNWKIKRIFFRYLWTQLGLSLELLFHRIDVLFIPAHTVPIIHPKNTVVAIHGLEYEFCPKAYSFLEKIYMRFSIRNSCRWAKKIIAVSENTKKDLINLYEVPDEKISVVYEGISSCHSERSEEESGPPADEAGNLIRSFDDTIFRRNCSAQDDKQKYLLFIGRIEERKNIIGIIEAFEILKEKYKIPHKLILAGGKGYGFKYAYFKILNSEYRNDILYKGFVSEEEKYSLLKNADVFLFPSFYEGFGLPILEAQSFGVPVVTSNVSSMPEIANSSALLINPKLTKNIAESVYQLISDEKFRKEMINKGFENVKRFSWEKCAEEISKIIID